METLREQKEIRRYFEFFLVLKGIFAAFEIVLGALSFLVPPAMVLSIVNLATQNQLAEDPDDFIATHLLVFAHHYLSVSTHLFASFYLLINGIIKLFLVVMLLNNKLWAYPAALSVLGLFMLYEVYRVFHTHSIVLSVLIIFDAFVLWFIYREYRIDRAKFLKKQEVAA